MPKVKSRAEPKVTPQESEGSTNARRMGDARRWDALFRWRDAWRFRLLDLLASCQASSQVLDA